MTNQFQALSEAISEPITKAYRVGGFGLAFLLLGALMIFAGAVFSVGPLVYPLAGIGLVLILIPCYFFYAKEIRPISIAQKALKQSSEMVDAVQDSAMEVTGLIHSLQALAFKHRDQLSSVLGAVQPQIKEIPGLDKLSPAQLLIQSGDLDKNIVFGTTFVKAIVENLQEALIHNDAKQIEIYLDDIRRIKAEVDALLALPAFKPQK